MRCRPQLSVVVRSRPYDLGFISLACVICDEPNKKPTGDNSTTWPFPRKRCWVPDWRACHGGAVWAWPPSQLVRPPRSRRDWFAGWSQLVWPGLESWRPRLHVTQQVAQNKGPRGVEFHFQTLKQSCGGRLLDWTESDSCPNPGRTASVAQISELICVGVATVFGTRLPSAWILSA